MFLNRLIAFSALLVTAASVSAQESDFTPDQIQFFTDKVYPILSENCFECHGGGEKLKGGLFLTSRESMLTGGDSGPVFELGELDDTLFAEMISYEDEFTEMPPDGKLPDDEIAVLQEWMAMGAPWNPELETEPTMEKESMVVDEKTKDYWAYKPVATPLIPKVPNAMWASNPIDALVYDRLRQNDLEPNTPADKATLIRRAYYDLTGLPPTPEEVQTFVNDDSPDAYEGVLDRLLASPHYGEKWARHWLDVVRYADSHGFERDENKPFMWRYRDYVVNAFNADKPYTEFITDQLAGDEYDTPTPESITATGYYRLGQWDDEPADPTQAVFDNLDDLVSTTTQTFLATTVGCARCHDHKIDPVPQADYYRFLAFFRNITETKRTSDYGILHNVMNVMEQAEYDAKVRAQRLQQAKLVEEQYSIVEAFKEAAIKDDVEWLDKRDARLSDLTDLSYRFYRDTWDTLPDFDMVKVETSDDLTHNYITTVPASRNEAIGLVYEGKLRVPAKGEFTFHFDARDGVRLIIGKDVVFESRETGMLKTSQTVELKKGLEKFRLEYFTKNGPPQLSLAWEGQGVGKRSLSISGNDTSRGNEMDTLLREHGVEYVGKEKHGRFRAIQKELKELRDNPVPAKRAPAVADKGIDPPDTFVLIRGSAHAPGDKVEPGFPQVLSPPEIQFPEPSKERNTTFRRTVLAQWLASEENPLTARVMANRIWQHHFGRGIVRSSNDFGKLGEQPTHPLLLDWLAQEFMDNGWRMKPLHKTIMMSNTYRMSSRAQEEALAKDPANNLFWRYDMRRLTAEEVRDSLLATTGEINLSLGGPTVFPTLPAEVIETSSKKSNIVGSGIWGVATPEDEVRRSLYIHTKRSLRHPMLSSFDSADVDASCPVRFTTTQPGQALSMLNSDYVHDRATALLRRVQEEAGSNRDSQIERAFELALGRKPSPRELEMSHTYLNELQTIENQPPARAMQRLCLLVLNLNEFLYLD